MQGRGQDQAVSPPAKEKPHHLKDYLGVVLTRKWILISTLLVAVAGTFVYLQFQAPVYRATCQLEFKPSNLKLIPTEDVLPTPDILGGQTAFQSFLDTQYELILSPAIVEETFSQYRLQNDPEFAALKAPEEKFRKLFEVRPVKDTRLADVTFDWKDPELAVRILNFLVDTYLRDYKKGRTDDTTQALEDLRTDAEGIRGDLARASEKMQDFLDDNNILSFEKEEDIVLKRLLQLNEGLTKAENERIAAESRYNDITRAVEESERSGNTAPLDEIPEVIESQAVHALQSQLLEIQMELYDLRKRYGSNHPEVQANEMTARYIEDKLAFEKQRILSSLKRAYQRLVEQEENLRAELEEQQNRVSELNRQAGAYKLLVQEYETAKENYDTRAKRIAEIKTLLDAGSTNISTTFRALVSPYPVKPKKALSMALAGIIGLLLGVGLCFFVEYLDTTIKTKDDVEGILATPVLGYIPPIAAAGIGSNGTATPELAAADKPHSLLAEAFRSIRTALLFSEAGRGLKNLLVTSPMPSEGKTLVSLNIAIALAQAGKKVLLVDADMRRPRLHKVLDKRSEPGLSNLLAGEGETSLDAAAIATGVPNLFFLPSGVHPPNPAELLGSDRTHRLVRDLSLRFDHVIFDTPPAVNTSDAAVLSQHVEGIVLVVRSFSTERELALRALDNLRSARGNVLGAVLNNVDVPKGAYSGLGSSYYYYYHPYYAYYSDEGADEEERPRRRKSGKPSRAARRASASPSGGDDPPPSA